MFAASKGVDLNLLVPVGQLYWAFSSRKDSLVKHSMPNPKEKLRLQMSPGH